MNIAKIRRENLRSLIDVFKTQSVVANLLRGSAPTQPSMSNILWKRAMKEGEARNLEDKIGIPRGWMDQECAVSGRWPLIERFRSLDAETKKLFNEMAAFTDRERTSQP